MRARCCIYALSLLIAAPALARGQAVSGALEGRVLSAPAEPVPNAVVTVSGPFLQGVRSVTSDARGRFLVLWLPAGTYTVRLRAMGFRPLTISDVRVGLGATASVGEVTLGAQALELSEVVVSGARPHIDPTTAAAATVLDSAVFLALPTDRNFRSLVALTPEANPSPYGDGVNVAGATGIENGYFVDGIHVTEPNRGNGSLNLPLNFVREVRIATGGYEAEFGRAQGAVVNVVTNSGGNQWRGQAVGFYTGNALRSAPRWAVGESRVDRYSMYDVGVSLSGPIQRDRVWFFLAYNPTVESRDATFPGITKQRDSRISHPFAGKLSARVGTGTDVALTLLGDPSGRDFVGTSNPLFPVAATVTDARAVLGRRTEGGTAISLQMRHQLGSRIWLAWSLARLDQRADNTPRGGLAADPAATARFDDHLSNTTAGGYGAFMKTSLARTAAQASLSLLAGAHYVKFGAEYEVNAVKDDEIFADIVTRDVGGTLADTVYGWLRINAHVRARNAVPSVYMQDAWEVTPRLRVNAGVRWEGQFISGDTSTARWIAPEIAPRLGAVFQPGELGSQKVYLSVGRFYEVIPLLAVSTWVGVLSQTYGTYPHNPLVDSTGGVVQGGVSAGEAPDRSVRGQYYDEASVGYERRIGREWRAGLRGTVRVLRWAVEDGARDVNSSFVMGNPGRGALSYLPRARRDYAALELTLERTSGPFTFLASYVLSRNWGNYTGLFATDAPIAGPNAGPQFDFPEQSVGATGLLPNDRTHVVKLFGSYRFPIGLTVGTSAIVASGTPLSEYGTSPYTPYWTFIRPRGTAGRTPMTWNVDLRFTYDVPTALGARVRPRVQFDVFNVGNQRKALTYDQRHYLAPDQTGVNPNYGAVTQYQAPLSARLGFVLGI